MIIWLASYPKSGNTLIRSMLSAYLFSKDGVYNFDIIKNIRHFPNIELFEKLNINPDNDGEIIKNYVNVQNSFNDKNSIQFLKTHSYLFNFNNSYPFTNLNVSLGVIYIVRDPRNVVSSLAKFESKTTEQTANLLTQNLTLGGDLNSKSEYEKTTVYVGTWGSNYNSWKSFKKFNKYLLIKYEDLISDRKKIFLEILEFIYQLNGSKLEINDEKLKNVLETTEFEYLQNLEAKYGFDDARIHKKSKEKIPFFNLGPKRDWRKSTNKKIYEEIEKIFQKEMRELGYL